MENAIQSLVKVYLKSTKGKEYLGKKEFQNLVTNQLGNILSDSDSNEAVNNMAQGLDANQDGKVGFQEYMKLIGYLAVSLSEQRNQNAASGQVTQSTPGKEDEKPDSNEEVKPEANEEPKAEATAEAKVEANADAKVEVKAEAAKEEPAAAAVVVEATTEVVEVSEKEEVETVVEEVAPEKPPAAAEEEVEKTDEAAS